MTHKESHTVPQETVEVVEIVLHLSPSPPRQQLRTVRTSQNPEDLSVGLDSSCEHSYDELVTLPKGTSTLQPVAVVVVAAASWRQRGRYSPQGKDSYSDDSLNAGVTLPKM